MREEDKFTVEQLVQIGDAIHDSSAAFIITNTVLERNEQETKNEAFLCMKGNVQDLTDLLYTALNKDEQMFIIIQQVMMQIQVEKLKDLMNRKDI
jgi:hypothetical protein